MDRIKPLTPNYNHNNSNNSMLDKSSIRPGHTALLWDMENGPLNRMVKTPSNEKCLAHLLTFQTFFGVTYLGRCAYMCRLPGAMQACVRPLITFVLTCYQLSSIVFLVWMAYFYNARGVFENYFDTITKKKALKFIFEINVYAMGLEFIMLQVFSFVRGPVIADIIFQIGPEIHLHGRNYRQYLCIYPTLLFLALIGTLSPISLFEEVWVQFGNPVWGALAFAFEGALGAINKSWIMTIHIYASAIICQSIDNFHANLENYNNYGNLLQDMINLKRRVNCLNQKMGRIIFFKLFLNCVMLASYTCGLVERMEATDSNPMAIVAILTLILQIFIIESGSCYSSQRVQNRIAEFIESIQELIARSSMANSAKILRQSPHGRGIKSHVPVRKVRDIDPLEYHCLEQICTMGEQLSFSVCNMFVLKSVTVVVISTNVLNYAILLIQTTDNPVYYK